MPSAAAKPTTKSSKKPFSRFKLKDAYQELALKRLQPWSIDFTSIAPSADFTRQYQRFQVFDLKHSEEGRKIIIDLVFVEALQPFPRLKIWKGEWLESAHAQGAADYLITENFDYAEAPLLCVAEAKKDDFEQGLAQCLVEMQACQWANQNIARSLNIYGIVTNAEGWKFYQLTTDNQVYETELYALKDLPDLLGILNGLFTACDRNIQLR